MKTFPVYVGDGRVLSSSSGWYLVVDAAAHHVVRSSDELWEYMPEPRRSGSFPGPERYEYAAPHDEYVANAAPEDGPPATRATRSSTRRSSRSTPRCIFFAEGVFERLPGLRVVCGDGDLSAITPVIWRFDKDWRSTREEVPWTTRLPSHAIPEHVRFCAHRADVSLPPADPTQWHGISGAGGLLLHASDCPSWDFFRPEELAGLENGLAERVLGGNARELYGLPVPEAAALRSGASG